MNIECDALYQLRTLKLPMFSYRYSQEVPAKCANCGGAHTAANTVCEVYTFRLTQINKGRVNDPSDLGQGPALVPAPQPATNIWEVRAKKNVTSATSLPGPELSANALGSKMMTQKPSEPTYIAEAVGGHADFGNLIAEMKKLNDKINLKQTIAAI